MEEWTLTVVYTAKPGMRETFVEEVVAAGIIEKIRAEEGCLAYDYYVSEDDADRLMLIEKWASEEHQQTHMTQPHMQDLAAIKARYIDETKIERY